LTHINLEEHHVSEPQVYTWRNAGDLIREGAGESGAICNVCSFQIVDFITLKKYDFNKIGSLGSLWFSLTDSFFPTLAKTIHRDVVLDQNQIAECHRILEYGRDQLNYVGLKESAKYISNIREKLNKGEITKYVEYYDQCGILFDFAMNEIEGVVFGFIPKDHGAYFEQEALFGVEVNDKFPEAKVDIKEAGNCYAHGTYTACVFHLMRVLEFALHKLAKDLGVTFPTAVELENWKNIIDKIDSAIKAQEQLPKSTQKSEDLQFYSEAAKEFRYFKDAWRNHVSHSRMDYEIHDATKIMEHVRDFMRHLATR
jgi:hypothetical protein